ncbi:MAG: hypothetical protein MUF81_01995 [Verrucomicrobia bacterium]|nr:hypothetical protein [Verrucomicrobiota bacterium]
MGDPLYNPKAAVTVSKGRVRLALRAVRLGFPDPFTNRMIHVEAPAAQFLGEFGFASRPVNAD